MTRTRPGTLADGRSPAGRMWLPISMPWAASSCADLALSGSGYPSCETRQDGRNVCDALDDIELPPGEDDDEDADSGGSA